MAQYEMENTAYQQEQSYKPSNLKWTIMIYLAGDNNLSASSIAVMQELEAANHREDVRVLACFDSNTPRSKGARYLEINHRRNTANIEMEWGLHNDLVPLEEIGAHAIIAPDFCNEDVASIHLPDEPVAQEGLSRFLTFALKYHRAERHMLILFGHGTAVAGNTFLSDNNPPSFLRLRDFADVLALHFGDGRPKLDILACHNCVMNGIESAYQIRRQVKFMLGSQGLVLAAGWPYRKIINAVERNPTASSKRIALRVLKACARGLLDFSLMDRSSEQALCDLRQFGHNTTSGLINAVDELAKTLYRGLEFKRPGWPGQQPQCDAKAGELCYPLIREIIRLARLEAQSYWDETFVDLYDFCELLLNKCKDFLPQMVPILTDLNCLNSLQSVEGDLTAKNISVDDLRDVFFANTPIGKLLKEIIERCHEVLKEVKKFVPYSYYVGPELQYSHGLSIYFPWTLPEDPIIFDPTHPNSNDFLLKTAFDEYKTYDFAQNSYWATFLDRFFRATLRNVRNSDYTYVEPPASEKFLFIVPKPIPEENAPAVNLRKAGPDVDTELACTCPKIKNYPRRFYLSPADCLNRCVLPPGVEPTPGTGLLPCVSYLGWNLRGLIREVIGLPPSRDVSEPADETNDDSQP